MAIRSGDRRSDHSDGPIVGIQVTRVASTRVIAGSVFCPRCGWRIGAADSPSIEYQKQCGGCRRTLAIAVEDARVLIVVEDDVAAH